MRFFRGSADEPTARTLRRQHNEAQQLDLALGEGLANGLVFRLALEAGAAEGVDRAMFLALRGDEGHVECFWPVPIDEDPEQARPSGSEQLRFLTEDGATRSVKAAVQRRHRMDKAAICPVQSAGKTRSD